MARFNFGRFLKSLLRTTASAASQGVIGRGRKTAAAGAIGGAVMDKIEDATEKKVCPHCGKEID